MERKEEYNDESNLFNYITVLLKHKILIIVIVAVFVTSIGVISFLSPKIYQSKAVIMPATQKSNKSNMSAIAMQFGISTSPTSNESEVVSLLKSNILMERVINNYSLLPVLFRKDELAEMPETSKTWNGIRYLKKNIYSVNHNKREGVIELAVEFRDPKTSADILKYILSELTDYMSSEAKRVAETNKIYLESLIEKNPDPLIKQKIYYLIAQQIETSMMAEVKENFAFKMLDPPKVPDRKVKPMIITNIILSFIISLAAAVFLAFFLEYYNNMKELRKTAKAE